MIENKEAKNPLLEAEIKGKITKLLETRGYPVTTFEKADYCLFFAYGMGEPRSVSVGHAGLFWQYRLGGGRGIWLGRRLGRLGRPLRFRRDALGGLRRQRHPLRPLAADQRGGGARLPDPAKMSRPVWVGEARSVGASSDLRMVLNYLLVADFKEFGKNTGQAVPMEIEAENPEVYSLTH